MNGIIGMTELTLDSNLTRSQRESCLVVHSLSRSLLLIIDDILDISKSTLASLFLKLIEPIVAPFQSRPGVWVWKPSPILFARPSSESSRHSLSTLPRTTWIVPTTLIPTFSTNWSVIPSGQVIANLVGNAIKFTPSKISSKGHVALSTWSLALVDSSVTLEFCVLDTGIGIAKDKLNLIFDTFCQADGSTTRVSWYICIIAGCNVSCLCFWRLQEYGGTGLGLSISKRLVSLMQGNMLHVGREWAVKRKQVLLHHHIPNLPEQGCDTRKCNLSTNAQFFSLIPWRTRLALCREYKNPDSMHTSVVVHNLCEVADKDRCPHIDTIVVDNVKVVCVRHTASHLISLLIVRHRLKPSANMSICDTFLLFFSYLQCPDSIVSACIHSRVRYSRAVAYSQMVPGQQYKFISDNTCILKISLLL